MNFLCFDSDGAAGFNATVITDPSLCSGYIAESSIVYQQTPTLYDLFTIPLTSDLQQMFMLGISIPVISYMTAWGYGVVINWFSKPDDY